MGRTREQRSQHRLASPRLSLGPAPVNGKQCTASYEVYSDMHSTLQRLSNVSCVPPPCSSSVLLFLLVSPSPPTLPSVTHLAHPLPHRALATTVLLSLLSAIALSSFVIPSRLPPASLALSHLNVVLGRPHHDRFARDREYAFVKFDLDADLAPLFHWNTKQVFVYLAADYSTPDHVRLSSLSPSPSLSLSLITSTPSTRLARQHGRRVGPHRALATHGAPPPRRRQAEVRVQGPGALVWQHVGDVCAALPGAAVRGGAQGRRGGAHRARRVPPGQEAQSVTCSARAPPFVVPSRVLYS